MAKKPALVDWDSLDLTHILADKEEIRKQNPHRYEMEMLTAIVYEDYENQLCIGYQDVSPDSFWVRGHMPGYPIMPGVLICESAAQLASFYAHKLDYLDQGIMGNARPPRRPVKPSVTWSKPEFSHLRLVDDFEAHHGFYGLWCIHLF